MNNNIDKKFQELWNKHVPSKGMAKTIKGEAVRCIGRLDYDINNNAMCNDMIYEVLFLQNYFSDNGNVDFRKLKNANKGKRYNDEKIFDDLDPVITQLKEMVINQK